MSSTHSVGDWAACLFMYMYSTRVGNVARDIPYHYGIWCSTMYLDMHRTLCVLVYILRSIYIYVESTSYIPGAYQYTQYIYSYTAIPNHVIIHANSTITIM